MNFILIVSRPLILALISLGKQALKHFCSPNKQIDINNAIKVGGEATPVEAQSKENKLFLP